MSDIPVPPEAAVEAAAQKIGNAMITRRSPREIALAMWPVIAASERELLERAEDALHSIALDLLAVSPHLKVPYTDLPEASPWSMYTGPQARRAHDLAMEIRKRLGLPHRWRTRAAGTPPLEERDVAAAAAAGERKRICQLADRAEAFYPDPDAPGMTLPFTDLIGDPDA